jgi:ribonuclease HI
MADAGQAEFLAYCATRPLARRVPGAEHAQYIRWCSYEMFRGNRVVWHGEGMHAPAAAVVDEAPAPPPWEDAPGDGLRIPATEPAPPAEEALAPPPSGDAPEPAPPAEEAPAAPRSRRRRPVLHADDTAERLIAYTDGSGTRAHMPAGAGVVVLFEGAVVLEAARHLGNGTNNHAELSAVRVALAITDTPEWRDLVLLVRSDSEYTIGALTRPYDPHHEVVNAKLIRTVRAAMSTRRVRFEHVKGHAGYVHNERADVLANIGRKR